MSEILKDLDDKQLWDEVQKAGLVEKLASDPAWAVVKEASDRVVNKAIAEFALKTDAKDVTRVIMLQVIIKKYRFGLFDELRMLESESNAIFNEAKERGLIGGFFHDVKEKIFK